MHADADRRTELLQELYENGFVTVLVESEEGKGSTFTMKLPAVVEDSLGSTVSSQ